MEINVLALRTRLGMTPEEFAREIGASTVTVWRWENKKRKPRGLYAKAIAELAKRNVKRPRP